MGHLQKFYYRLRIYLLDLGQDISAFLLNNSIIPEWEYTIRFGTYLQKKAILNRRIQRIGGSNA